MHTTNSPGPPAGFPSVIRMPNAYGRRRLAGRSYKQAFLFLSYSGFSVHNSSWPTNGSRLRIFVLGWRLTGPVASVLESWACLRWRRVYSRTSLADCSPMPTIRASIPAAGGVGKRRLILNPIGDGIDIGSPTPGGASQLGVYPLLAESHIKRLYGRWIRRNPRR